jgi:hypothetical protein
MTPNKEGARRRWLWPALVALTVTIVVVTAALWFIWIPNRRLADLDYLQHASPAELRRVAERALESPWGNHHDACLLLSRVGDAGSVPLLLHSLRWQPQPSPSGDTVEDTTVNCAQALKQLTGHDAGIDPRRWQEWWSATGSKLPPSSFPLHE